MIYFVCFGTLNVLYLSDFPFLTESTSYETVSIDFTKAVTEKVVITESYNITVTETTKLVKGATEDVKAVQIGSKDDSVTIKFPEKDCFGNIDNCKDGFTLSTEILFESLREDTYYFSAGDGSLTTTGFSLLYKFNRFQLAFITKTETWYVSFSAFKVKTWSKFEFTWTRSGGLLVYVDSVLVGSSTTSVKVTRSSTVRSSEILIGSTSRSVQASVFRVAKFSVYSSTRKALVTVGVLGAGMLVTFFDC